MEERNNLTRDEARARAALVRHLRYRVDLELTGEGDTFRSEVEIRFDCIEPGASTFMDLLAESVDVVELNGRDLGPDVFDGVRVNLPDLEEHNTVRVVARCAYSHTGVGLHRFRDPVDDLVYLYSDLEPFDAHRVFACFDQPDQKGTFEFSVVAPSDWVVVSNMPRRGDPVPEGGGLSRWMFPPTPRMSTYITAVVAGAWHEVRRQHGRIDLGLLARRSLAQFLEPDEVFEISAQGFDFFERLFDYPYPLEKYDQVMVPQFNSGAMENWGCVTFNESYVFRSKVTDAARERRAETILHEMAHMWFGNLVTMRWWDDLWLNESFATFTSTYALDRATRFDDAWTTFTNDEKTWAYYQDQLPSTHPIVADMPDTDSIRTNFDGITYAKGASVLRQLVAYVGEEEFFQGLREYFRRHEYGNTDLNEFLSALEETSGRDLKAWAKEWLQTAEVNVLRASFETTGSGDQETFSSFTVRQEAPEDWPVLRPHRLAVGLYDRDSSGLTLRHREELDVAGESTDVPKLVGVRVPDLVLVNDEDLTYARIRLDERSLRAVTAHLGEVHDSLARALCWGAAWDMVRDAEMPARDFVELFLRSAAAEDNIGMVQRLQGQARRALEVYGDLSRRDESRERLAAVALERLGAAEPGSDFQLAWGRAFASAARSPAHVALVRDLLLGGERVEGLQVDTELRWHLVRSLAAVGTQDAPALIDAEVARDDTEAGRRHAAAARAALPDAGAKRETWDRIVGDPSIPTSVLSWMMDGFHAYAQEDLLRPYVERYFAALEPMRRERTFEVALAFARDMYPSMVLEQETIEATDRHLESGAPPGPIRRVLIEGRDEVRRAMKARGRDRSETTAGKE